MSESEITWQKCLEIIEQKVTAASYKQWFAPIKPLGLENGTLILEVPSRFFVETLEGPYFEQLKYALRTVIGNNASLQYKVHIIDSPEGIVTETGKTNTPVQLGGGYPQIPDNKVVNPFVLVGRQQLNIDPQLNEDFTFDNYIIGNCNKLAWNVADAVAKKPGELVFNPLFIFGNSGVGKTHLIQAIGAAVKDKDPSKNVIYLSANRFMRQYMDATKNNVINGFLNFYQMIDVLIIDDIQEIAGKQGTESVFFQIFNHLQQNKKQIIIASDKAPVDIVGMEDRLLSRFKSGVVAEVSMPDYDTRVKIIKNRIERDGIQITDDVVCYIANNVSSSVRELEGTLVSMLAFATLTQEDLTMDVARHVVGNLVKTEVHDVNVDSIIKAVCDYYDIETSSLQKNTRKREIVMARQVAMYLCKELTQTSLSTIGMKLGNRNHSTVLYSCKTVKDTIDTDKEFEAQVKKIEAMIKG